MSQWKEMMEDPAMKIGRPRQIYLGSKKRDYPKDKEEDYREDRLYSSGIYI